MIHVNRSTMSSQASGWRGNGDGGDGDDDQKQELCCCRCARQDRWRGLDGDVFEFWRRRKHSGLV